MNIKRIILILVIGYFVTIAYLFFFLAPSQQSQLDIVEVNNIIQTLATNWTETENYFEIPEDLSELDFVVITNYGEVLAATRDNLNTNMNAAISNRDTIVDIPSDDGEGVVGKVIFYNSSEAVNVWERSRVTQVTAIILTIYTIGIIGYILYLFGTIIRPFQKLESFAKQVAAGNLDVPLEMDRYNLFGAFTESFDLMREELDKARENERQASISKKELVAGLSHDIKTPVASIKAVTELMYVLAKDEKEKGHLETISTKAEQINVLITDMFHATLEELKALPVRVGEIESQKFIEILKRVDYNEQLMSFSIPNALIFGDLLRIEQVFDNIITNAYKYAKTEIQINAYFKDEFLVIEIMDFGSGVPDEELPLLLQKFYRGSAVGEEKGYGLGLHISNYLIKQMDGKFEIDNHEDGFLVRIALKLVGN